MIRRGLQILIVGITALGAAPSHAENFPPGMTLQDFQSYNGFDPNGAYVVVGETGTGGALYQKYLTDPQNAFTLQIDYFTSYYRVRIRYGGLNSTQTIGFKDQYVPYGSFPQSGWVSWAGVGGYVPGTNATGVYIAAPPDVYEEAFPDWEAASVKIPLGFTFGMSVWAAFLAATIALKWVRDLSSAAT